MHRRLLLLALVASLLQACSTSTLVNQWREPQMGTPRYAKVLVIGISDEEAARRTFEDVFSARLRARGLDARPGHEWLPRTGQADEQTLLESVRDSGAEAVLITRVVRVEDVTRYLPGPVGLYPMHRYHGYYMSAWAYFEAPRIHQYRVAVLETNLWAAASGRLVWSGSSETLDPRGNPREADELAGLIVGALAEQGLIK